MKIRKAKIGELQEIITLNKIVNYHQSDSFMKESVMSWRVFVIAWKDGIKGFLLYQELWGNTTLLSLLKVHSSFYQKWIGTKLLEYFEEYLKKQWITSYMSSTMPDNAWAQVFHKKKGFQYIGTLDMHYGDEIFYRKEL